jgi:hypothetical protein
MQNLFNRIFAFKTYSKYVYTKDFIQYQLKMPIFFQMLRFRYYKNTNRFIDITYIRP